MSARTLRVVRTAEDPVPGASDRLLKVAEVAKVLGIGKTKAYELAAAGHLPTVQIPDSPLIRVSARALDEWIRARGRAAVAVVERGGAASW